MTQHEALEILKTGANVFLTGEPGSGKTFTINRYVAWLREHGVEPSITASTGIAATHIGGYTIHSWSGIGIRASLTDYDLDAISQNKRVAQRVTNARILIIDEISMLPAHVLSMVDMVCREIRQNQQPFGGSQIILVGDFFQLPPVQRRTIEKSGQKSLLLDEQARFAFLSPTWNALNPLVCYLSEQHRQEDAVFLEFLSAIRQNTVSESHRALLRTRYARTAKNGTTQLYAHNADVDLINKTELAKLTSETHTFEMTHQGPEHLVTALQRGCLSPEILKLKIGARIMFTRNDMGRKFVNGTLGIVDGFSKESGHPIIKTNAGRIITAEPEDWSLEDGGKILARITQVPLRLAWAMTVHKSQGMSLDAAHMDLSQTFEYGQGYVALSRVRTLAGLSLAGLNERALQIHPDIYTEDGGFREKSERAQEIFAQMPKSNCTKLQTNFITSCGGKP